MLFWGLLQQSVMSVHCTSSALFHLNIPYLLHCIFFNKKKLTDLLSLRTAFSLRTHYTHYILILISLLALTVGYPSPHISYLPCHSLRRTHLFCLFPLSHLDIVPFCVAACCLKWARWLRRPAAADVSVGPIDRLTLDWQANLPAEISSSN